MDPAALVVFTTTLPRIKAVDDSAVGGTPVPDSDTTPGVGVAIFSEPAGWAPRAVGLRVKRIAQVVPGGRYARTIQVDRGTMA